MAGTVVFYLGRSLLSSILDDILPNAQHYTIARFVNRQDADDRRRALCRFILGGVFEVVMCDRA
jgi:hypothetical protein